MSVFVVDASVAMKWFVPEIQTDHALRLQDPVHDLHAPAFLDLETTNILWKKLERQELARPQADSILGQIGLLPLTRHAEGPLLPVALDLADRYHRSVYDCIYLAWQLS
jgi:predicted nucleic acid-binding protein